MRPASWETIEFLTALEMLAAGCVDVLASDTHGDNARLVGTDWLIESGGEEQVDLLTRENARRLWRVKRCFPCTAQRPRGMRDRLREFVLGRRDSRAPATGR